MPAPDRRKVALVTTTINVPRCIEAYMENIAQYGHSDRVEVIVVGDRKTPAGAATFLQDLHKRFGSTMKYLDVGEQQAMLRRWPVLDGVIRWNSIQRRNVGYLQAGIDGAEILISFDDDNFVHEDVDYLAAHAVTGTRAKIPVVRNESGWYNVCERLECDPPRRFYHRGYPKSAQSFEFGGETVGLQDVNVIVNAGLWLKNPDVDATANIEEPLNVVKVREVESTTRFALAYGTWCPFNSQNTALHRDLLPALYLVVMGDWLRGYKIGRLDDIWQSYFIRALGDQLGGHVAYGPPVVTQDRNPHNFTKDLSEELGGYILTERLIPYLRAFKTSSKTWSEGYLDLTYHLRESLEADPALDRPEREYLRQMTLGMAAWQEAVRDIQG